MRSGRSAWASPGEVGRSELATRTQVHYWGSPLEREGSQAAQEATQKANILHKCTILNHHSFIRSFSRSPVRSHGSSLGREGVAGAPHSTIARSLARQFESHGSPLGKKGRHWGTRRHKCTIGASHWEGGVTGGARGDTEGYTSAPYSTTIRLFVRSFARSLARQCALTAHHWGGKGLHTGRHT